MYVHFLLILISFLFCDFCIDFFLLYKYLIQNLNIHIYEIMKTIKNSMLHINHNLINNYDFNINRILSNNNYN